MYYLVHNDKTTDGYDVCVSETKERLREEMRAALIGSLKRRATYGKGYEIYGTFVPAVEQFTFGEDSALFSEENGKNDRDFCLYDDFARIYGRDIETMNGRPAIEDEWVILDVAKVVA